MKRNYFAKWCMLAVLGLMSSFSVAQNPWKANQPTVKKAVPCERQAEGGVIHFGYTMPDAIIYPYDGLSIDRDARVGVAILLPREKFADYIGGKLTSLYLGWDTEEMNGQVEAFVRTSFHGKNLASGKGELTLGWNLLDLDAPLEIPDVDTLVLGYYTQLKKDVIAIPKLYPKDQKNSCCLWMEGDMTPDGKEGWIDACDLGTMAILGVIDDEEGAFNNMLKVDGVRFDCMVDRDSVVSALVGMANVGSNPINELEVTSDFKGKQWKMNIPLGGAIRPSSMGRVMLPYCAQGSGQNRFYISKVNGVEVKNPKVFDMNLVTIPKEVSSRYTPHALVEFWTSENMYSHVTYFEEYTRPTLEKYGDRLTMVCQHVDDQFMMEDPFAAETGVYDVSCQMMLDFVNNDSLRVFLPSMSINRNRYVENRAADDSGPLFPVLYPEYGDMLFGSLLDSPTFADVKVNAQLPSEGGKAHIEVTGNVAEGVLPEGESLYLTAYLVEYDVESDSQIFWDEEQSKAYNGVYKHYNVIRQMLTPCYGNRLDKTGGDYKQEFEVALDETWNTSKLAVVAFLNRGIQNSNVERQVINCGELKFQSITGIDEVAASGSAAETPVAIYNMAGVRVSGLNGKGVYLVKSLKDGKPVVRKVMVK